ncbi:MAG: CocE/NonD family hydrolase [Acidimicrobiales bacterium]
MALSLPLALGALGLVTIASPSPAQAAGVGFTQTSLTIPVVVGPDNKTHCNILAYLFMPADATAGHPDPAVLTTNGFGGSRDDQVSLAKLLAARGYVVLDYSGLGFGGSGCNIELDSPNWDGKAGAQLVGYLAGLDQVARNAQGRPTVGMVGGSYGGEIQFATEAVCHCLSAIVPIITWNDLAYSLGPNNNAANFVHTDTVPGVLKYQWDLFFSGLGLTEPLQNPNSTPFPPSTCPGFDPQVCPDLATSTALGYPSAPTVRFLRSASVATYMSQIKAPTLLIQGEADSLFNLNEGIANYKALKAQHTPVHLVFQSWGHSNSTPAPGELSYTDPAHGYETQLIQDWFAHYLKHQNVSTGPAVEYFRPWISYDHAGSANPAYGTAAQYPAAPLRTMYLSGNGSLVATPGAVAPGALSFVNPPLGQTGSYSEISAVGSSLPSAVQAVLQPFDLPGTFASFTTPPLRTALDVVGVPSVTFNLTSLVPALGPATDPVIYGKLYDVAPGGTKTLIKGLVSPIRVDRTSGPVTLSLPGIVYQFGAGHHIQLVLATTDLAYLGGRVPNLLTVTVDPSHPSPLQLPVVAPGRQLSGGAKPPLLG